MTGYDAARDMFPLFAVGVSLCLMSFEFEHQHALWHRLMLLLSILLKGLGILYLVNVCINNIGIPMANQFAFPVLGLPGQNETRYTDTLLGYSKLIDLFGVIISNILLLGVSLYLLSFVFEYQVRFYDTLRLFMLW